MILRMQSVLVLAILLVCQPGAQSAITTGDLAREMVDLANLTKFPVPAYKTIQFSSYDRHSELPYSPGWYANNDGFGSESIPNFLEVLEEPGEDGVGKYLMAVVEGPGAIVRTWTARISGTLTVYLDGSEEPVYDAGADEFLRQTYTCFAKGLGLVQEPVGEGFAQRQACYFPIPFAKSLRIVWTGDLKKTHFYQLEVRKYPEGTEIQTFSPQDFTAYKEEIQDALQILASKGSALPRPGYGANQLATTKVNPGQSADLFDSEGPGAIQELSLKLDVPDLHRGLRQVILKGYFDGAPLPQIEAPLGDFFGSGPGVSPYVSLPMEVQPDGTMTCRFVMPFRDSARLVVENKGKQPAQATASVSVKDYDWNEERSMHFFAKWRVDHGLLVGGEAGVYDLPYLAARGKGVFVGAAAMILNPGSVPTSGGNWWGEGDEKIWFDDDRFPSLFGTGSEDYFNYAWSSPDLFHHAYFAQPLVSGPDNRGFNANIRWHILDPLPFSKRIDFFMELFHHTRTDNLSYARISYFYGMPDVRDDNRPIMRDDVTRGLDLPRNWKP